jgi:hypothetical protein
MIGGESADFNKQPWEQRDDETARAYEAFALYRSLGPERSCARVGQKLGKSSTIMDRWSARHEWVDRVRAYDAAVSREVVQDETEAMIRMNKRHIEESQKLQQVVLQRIERMQPEALTPADVARWLDIAVKIERKCMGLDETGGKTVPDTVRLGIFTETWSATIMEAIRDEPEVVQNQVLDVLERLALAGLGAVSSRGEIDDQGDDKDQDADQDDDGQRKPALLPECEVKTVN